MTEKDKISMDIVNPRAAGIDIGSRSHWVAVGQGPNDFKEFGVYNEDLYSIAQWLRDNEIKTVAMESTGTYWQSLYAVLIAEGFQVILCNGKFTKNIKGKKKRYSGLSVDSKTTQYWVTFGKLFTGSSH